MVIRHIDDQIKDYYERAEVNQSSLKVILNDGIQVFIQQQNELIKQDDLYYEEKRHFVIGQAVDTFITNGEDEYNRKYYSSRLTKKPSDTIMSIVRMTFDNAYRNFITLNGEDAKSEGNIDDEELQELLIQSITEHNYQSNWKLETKINKIVQEGSLYWNELIEAQGKQILSEEEENIIKAIINSILTHKHTSHLFKDSDEVDIIFQLPLFFEYEGISCKALLDMVIINHSSKKIIPIDIKTVGDYVLRFNRAIQKRRYDIQGAFYTYGIEKNKESILELCNRTLNSNEYDIANFAFLAESTFTPGTPMIYVLTNELLEQGRWGDNEEVKGFHQAIEIYREWLNAGFSIENMFDDTNGVVWVENDYNYQKVF